MANYPDLPPHIQIKSIAEIGNIFEDNFARRITFLSEDYLLDADVLLISISALQLEFSNMMSVDNITDFYLSRVKWQGFQTGLLTKKAQLEEYVNNGGVLFVFVDHNPVYTFKLGQGADAETIKYDFREIVLLNQHEFKTESMRGNNIVYTDELYLDFFQPWDVSYNFVYTRFKGVATAKVKKKHQAISVAVPRDKGLIFLLPELALSTDDYNDYANRMSDARLAILNFIWRYEESKPHVENVALPDWCKDFYLEGEKSELDKLAQLHDDIASIQDKIVKQEEKLLAIDLLKQMLTGTGKTLEGIVETVLKEIGFDFLPTEPGRDDLIIVSGNDIGVVEIKGVKGSASEQNATQLMKWVSNYHHANEIEPKGILIVNAFKDLPLIERTQQPFPDQMLTYSNRMQFSLITTYQLLGLFLDFRAGDKSFSLIKELLFKTVGRFDYVPTRITLKDTA